MSNEMIWRMMVGKILILLWSGMSLSTAWGMQEIVSPRAIEATSEVIRSGELDLKEEYDASLRIAKHILQHNPEGSVKFYNTAKGIYDQNPKFFESNNNELDELRNQIKDAAIQSYAKIMAHAAQYVTFSKFDLAYEKFREARRLALLKR